VILLKGSGNLTEWPSYSFNNLIHEVLLAEKESVIEAILLDNLVNC